MWAASEGEVERCVDCVRAELCYVVCSRVRNLSAVLPVLALNFVTIAASGGEVERSGDFVSTELCYVGCIRGRSRALCKLC